MLKLLLLLPLLINLHSAPEGDEGTFTWGERPLRWGDFKGKPPASSADNTVAQASSVIKLNTIGQTEGGMIVEIKVVFNPEGSWVLPGHQNPIVLNHEQRHFDIAEYHARRMRATLKHADRHQLVFQRISRDCDEMQDRYDRETRHGTDLRQQAIWDKKIEALLKSLDPVSNTRIIVKQ